MGQCLEFPFGCFIHPSMHVVHIPNMVEHGGICGSDFACPARQASQQTATSARHSALWRTIPVVTQPIGCSNCI